MTDATSLEIARSLITQVFADFDAQKQHAVVPQLRRIARGVGIETSITEATTSLSARVQQQASFGLKGRSCKD